MLYFFVLICLFGLQIVYFRIADRMNITDQPNKRSSHSVVTLRGGGIIFYFAILLFFLYNKFSYPWFFFGLTLVVVISFLDDIFTLSNRYRIFIHFVSVLLIGFQLGMSEMPLPMLLAIFVVVVGVINAYNFMDGINGITVAYSISVLALLLIVNKEIGFIENEYLIFSLLGATVFGYFNFRKNAVSFAGDVGSIGMAYIILFALGSLALKTGNIIYFSFLLVYGIDTVWTIIRRLYLRENIFVAHRSHLYQILANEAKYNPLYVAFSYGLIQFFVGLITIYYSDENPSKQFLILLIITIFISCFYLFYRKYITNRFFK